MNLCKLPANFALLIILLLPKGLLMKANATPPTNVLQERTTVLGMPFVSIFQMKMIFPASLVNANLGTKEMEHIVQVNN